MVVVAVTLFGAVAAFSPSHVAISHGHRIGVAATMSAVESVETSAAADDVLESLLEASAPTGMRRKMAESLRAKQIALTDLVSSADGEAFIGARTRTHRAKSDKLKIILSLSRRC